VSRAFASAALAVTLGACGNSGPGSASNDAGDASGAGIVCATERPAVAHGAGAQVLSPQPAGAPVPCAATTGFAAVDATLVITASGKIVFAPANLPGLTVSADDGATWSTPLTLPDQPSGTLLHPWLWQDAASHRFFYNVFSLTNGTCPDGSGATLWTSDDQGGSWTSGSVGCGSDDWGKVITGPPSTDASRTALAQSDYPDMVYYCATGPTAIIGPDHICYRSTDGGKTFTQTATDPVSGSGGGYPTAGVVGPDGTLYVPKGSPSGLAIAVSKDEGDTWTDAIVTGSMFVGTSSKNWLSMNVTVDAQGNLYAVWSDDSDLLPRLSVSKDEGATWSSPLAIGAPGVKTSAYPSVTVSSAGAVAVAYYGSTQARATEDGYYTSDGLPYSAYLVVTQSPLASAPVLWSATFNDPTQPVFTGLSYHVSEYLGYPTFASDGSIWGAYISGGHGLAGHLVFPAADGSATP
jgi:hypothetical protein